MKAWIVATAALAVLAPSAHTQDGAAGTGEVSGEAYSLSFGLDLPSQYFFRGIIQENEGFIVQPWIELGANLLPDDGDSPLGGLDLTVGLWNSLHSGPSGTEGGTKMWYESDFYLGVSTTVDDVFGFGATYVVYDSPNGSFATVQEFALSSSYDDSELWGDAFGGLQPSVMLAFELDNTALGTKEGVYAELAIAPSFELSSEWGIEATVPVTLGLGIDEYYQGATAGDDDTFGFFDIGVDVSMPMPQEWMPTRFGAWSLSVGAHALFLGSNTEAANNNGDFELIGTVGLGTSF